MNQLWNIFTDKVDRAVKSRDSEEGALGKLKSVSIEVTNKAAELLAEEVQKASNRYIVTVTLTDKQTVTSNAGICEAFRE